VSLVRDVPFSGVYYPVYEASKALYCKALMFDPLAPDTVNRVSKLWYVSILASINANFFSCILTHPFDIIRTRVFFQHYNKDITQHYGGIMQAMRSIYEYDGLIGYFRGLTPRLIRKGAGNVLAWGMYEYLVDRRTFKFDAG